MEQSYAEVSVKRKRSIGSIILQALAVIVVLILFFASMIGVRFAIVVLVAAGAALLWFWPRFKTEWEYVFCDGQLDFDKIFGGERRKHILRLELEHVDVVAPLDSSRLDGYRHLAVKDFSSMMSGAKLYGIATRLPNQEEKVLILFEPNERMIDMMYAKRPNVVEKGTYGL